MTTKFCIVLLIISSWVICVKTHISIDIDPVELQSIGEVLVESYLNNNLIQRSSSLGNTMIGLIQKCACSMLQYIAITCSLVGANIITTMLQHNVVVAPQSTNSTLVPSKLCKHDFGCDDNVCWRTCNESGNDVAVVSWCYTTPENTNSVCIRAIVRDVGNV